MAQASTRPLTFRDHILHSVPFDLYREARVGVGDFECVLVLVQGTRTVVCECHDTFAYCTIVEEGRAPMNAEEINNTDHVTALWDRP